MESKEYSEDSPVLYRLIWKNYFCYQQWVDYFKLNNIEDEEGTLMYRSKFSNSRYQLHSMPPSTKNALPESKQNQFPEGSGFVLKFKKKFKTFYMEFVDPKLKGEWVFRPFWISKPSFHVSYNGHRLVIVPSANSGVFNRNLDLEMRLLFPCYFTIPEARALEDVDYRVVWKHYVNKPNLCCSRTHVGHFFFQERILNSLATLSPPEGLPLKDSDCRIKKLPHIQEDILNLDLDVERFLCFSFAMIHVYLEFYASKKRNLFALILCLILIGITAYDLPMIFKKEK